MSAKLGAETRKAYDEGRILREQRRADIEKRLRHIRETDPDLPKAAIAQRLGITPNAVTRLSKELGLEPPAQSEGLYAMDRPRRIRSSR